MLKYFGIILHKWTYYPSKHILSSMEKYYLQTVGAQIVADSGHRLGRISNVVIKVDTGRVVGFLVAPNSRKVVVPVDILSWTNYIKVHDVHDLVGLDEVHQVADAIQKHIPIYGNKVITKGGENIGKVIDFGMDNKFFKLTCLVVAKSFLGIIFWDRKIISAKDIIEVTKKGIIIKNLVKPVKMKKLRVDMAAPSP